MKRLLVISLACSVVLVAASGVFAQEGACGPDIAKFCKGIQHGDGKLVQCLNKNEAQLSPGCITHLAQVKEALKEAHQACEDDITKFCGGVQPGGGRIAECLKANKSHLSRKCKVKLFEAKEEMK